MSEIEPIPPALQALYAEERAAPVAGPAAREQIRRRVLATIGALREAAAVAPHPPALGAPPAAPLPQILWGTQARADARGAPVVSWSAEERAAARRLFEQTHHAVTRFFANKVEGEVLDDLVQNTYLSYFGQLARLRGLPIGPTLLRIAHHVLMDHLRRRSRFVAQRDRERVDVERLIATDSPAEPFARSAAKEEHRSLLAALRRLPIKLQIVIELHYWEALNVREIAEVIRQPLGTVKTRLRDARAQLRNQLTRGDLPRELQQAALETLEGWADRVRTRVRDAS